ncbi:MAG: hypothetical protein IKG80_05180, partial [Clostridia bacterium]|nr:hypothetical protein [Clostridia bacterium]
TDNNSNVFFEIGFADAIGKDIILIRQKSKRKVPSDISDRRYLEYQLLPTDFERFKIQLSEAIKQKMPE